VLDPAATVQIGSVSRELATTKKAHALLDQA
jgi:hypothetical protein